MKTIKLIDDEGIDVLDNGSDSLYDFVENCDRMITLYNCGRYTQAEELKARLTDELDNIMRSI